MEVKILIERYSRPQMKNNWSENNTFELWLSIEIAACQAWSDQGIIPKSDMQKIRNAKFDINLYNKWFDETKHDLISFTRSISENLGSESRWIHHGLTSNDVKDTALSIQLRDSCILIIEDLNKLSEVLAKRAKEFKYTPSIGRSHGIHAEPMSFGLKFALWFSEINRHIERMNFVKEHISIGMLSGPVGTFSSIPPEIEKSVCDQLELKPALVSNQIIQRDRHAEYVQALALIASTLEKIATEIRTLQRTEIREVEEPFGKPGYVSKGSSSMPHKRNPELSERICGISRLIRGYTVTALDNVVLWNERDISHSSAERIILPESSIYLDYILNLSIGIIQEMKINKEQIENNLNLTKGIIFSPRVMLKLVEKGISREVAYDVIQSNAMTAWEHNKDFKKLILNDPKLSNIILSNEEVSELFDYNFYLQHVDNIFKRCGLG